MEDFETKIWNVLERTMYLFLIRILHFKFLKGRWDDFLQFVKFGLVGVLNTLISYISYLIFLGLNCHYLIASILSFVVSVTNSFYWNNKYVFKVGENEKRSLLKTYMKTFVSYASTGLILTNILLVLWIDIMKINEVIAPLLNLIITIPINYLINKFWAFKGK